MDEETLPTFVKKNHPKKKEKETMGMYQSPGKQTSET